MSLPKLGQKVKKTQQPCLPLFLSWTQIPTSVSISNSADTNKEVKNKGKL